MSKGYTNTEKALASNYAPETWSPSIVPTGVSGWRRATSRASRASTIATRPCISKAQDGSTVAWEPSEIGGRKGGAEVYRIETVELRVGDRIRWTRSDKGLGLVNSGTAEILGVWNGRMTFLLEEGRELTLTPGDPATAPPRLRVGFDRACFPVARGR